MASYANSDLRNRKIRSKSFGLRPFAAVAVILGIVLSMFGVLAATIGPQRAVQEADAFDPVNSVICGLFPDDALIRKAYQASQTDDLYFDLQSKSAVSSGKADVSSGLNWILMASGMDFNKVNEGIIGQEVEKAGTSLRETKTDDELKKSWNKGPQVSPFDRFGMAGTTFSSYNGEWKYYKVDSCSDEDPVDLKEGDYYEGRLEAKSTWEDRADSKDPRTVQHYKGETSRFWFGFVTLISNLIFWVTKLITTATIAFVSFSFSDISTTIGLDGILSGNSSGDGVFGYLFTGVYTPLIVLAMVATGFKIFIEGAVRRQFRNAFSTAAISVAMFLFAIVVSVRPELFVSFPNKAAVMVQAVIVKSFTGELSGDRGLCATDIGSKPIGIQKGTSGKDDQGYLDGIAANMRSSIGCNFWQTFVFKPWAQGQWGTDWNETWAKGKTAKWAPKGHQELQNTNGSVVGEATVPLGDGKVMHNWAVFNLSTMTNAHSPIGEEGHYSKYSQGVANDWWRTVDALTNYEEVANKDQISSAAGGPEDIEYTVPKGNAPLEDWDTWSGNNPGNRFASAISSLFIGAVGLIAPFFLGLMAAVYSLGMTIVMAFLPVMLLFGAWGGRGFEIFKQWAKLLWKLFTQRIAVGIMLMLSIVFVNAAIVLMDSVGWWQGALMLMVLTFIIIKSRHKIGDMLSASGGGSFAQVAGRISKGFTDTTRTIGGIAASTAGGAAYSKFRGGTMASGAKIGLGQELNNLSYRTPFLRDVRVSMAALKEAESGPIHGKDSKPVNHCALCQEPLEDGTIVKMGADGLWYCQFCAESEVQIEGGLEVIYRNEPSKEDKEKREARTRTLNSADDQASGGKVRRLYNTDMDSLIHDTDDNRKMFARDNAHRVTADLASVIGDIRDGKAREDSILGSNIPIELQPYLDPGMVKTLVENKDWEAVTSAFIAAYVMAIEAQTGVKLENLLDELLGAAQGDYRTTGRAELREEQLALPDDERILKLVSAKEKDKAEKAKRAEQESQTSDSEPEDRV